MKHLVPHVALLAFYDNTFFQESFKVLKEKYHHKDFAAEMANNKVKFEVYGEEMLEKEIKLSGNSGRVYLPSDWVGHKVKIIRVD